MTMMSLISWRTLTKPAKMKATKIKAEKIKKTRTPAARSKHVWITPQHSDAILKNYKKCRHKNYNSKMSEYH